MVAEWIVETVTHTYGRYFFEMQHPKRMQRAQTQQPAPRSSTFKQDGRHFEVGVHLVLDVFTVLLVQRLDEPRADVHVEAVGQDELHAHGDALRLPFLRTAVQRLLHLDVRHGRQAVAAAAAALLHHQLRPGARAAGGGRHGPGRARRLTPCSSHDSSASRDRRPAPAELGGEGSGTAPRGAPRCHWPAGGARR